MPKSFLALGLMSGTSADGITAALARFSGREVSALKFHTYPYASSLRKRVLAAPRLALPEISRLNMELGEAFAAAAQEIMRLGIRPAVIGSHGQTVWHGPNFQPPNTLQLGEPSVIAERTGITVVADFRPRDMAAGGQGAPLVAAFDEFFFGQGPWRALQNIGGVANVSFLGRGTLHSSFDTGPGNALMDLAVRLATRGRLAMDQDGRLAAQGQPNVKILNRMLAHPYFRQKPPKSLDKNFFAEKFMRRHFGTPSQRTLADTLATLALFTARSIAQACKRFSPHAPTELVVNGGGAKNPTLMRYLQKELATIPVARSDQYGIPIMAKEACAFAWLALRALEGKTNNCPQATGAEGRRILGKIIPGR